MSAPTDPFQVDEALLAACASEPIHIPGTIQPRGVLLVLDRSCETVCAASANAAEALARPLADIVGQPLARLTDHALPLRLRSLLATTRDGQVVMGADARPLPDGTSRLLLVHRYDDRVLAEFVDEAQSPAAELALASAVSAVAQTRRDGTAGEMPVDAFAVAAGFQRVARSLALDPQLQSLCQSVADEVRRFTGYDRVMVYQFDDEGNGAVVAEARDAALEPFLGLHYPATDIPAQARALYLRTRVRVLDDVDAVPVPLVAAPGETRPVDLSHALLRSMSPVHLQYLRNMPVGATLVVSIIVDGRLWGLVACHHRTPKWPSFAMRAACDMLAEFVAVQVTVQENFARARARAQAATAHAALIQRLVISGGRFEDVLEEIRALLPCGGLAVVAEERVVTVGEVPPEPRIRELVKWLAQRAGSRVIAFDALGRAAPAFADLADVAAGVLALDIGGTEHGFLLWFRPEQRREVRWAGAPSKTADLSGDVPRLSPRGSFAEWAHEVRGRSLPWTLEEHTLAESVRGAMTEVVLELLASRHRIARLDLVRIRSAVEAASDAVVVADPFGRAISVNASFMALSGLDADSLEDVPAAFGLPSVRPDTPDAALRLQRDAEIVGADGLPVPVALRMHPILDDAGTRIGLLAMATDLRPRIAVEAERRRLESKLVQTQKLESLGVLAGGIAHDFNNLLTTIVANAAIAHEELPAASDVRENVDAIARAAQHAASLCRELLAYAGRGRVETAVVGLNDLVRDMGTLLRTAIGSGITVDFRLAEPLPMVDGDAAQLRQVVMNLIVNASDAIGDQPGTIRLVTALRTMDALALAGWQHGDLLPAGRYVELRVSDTGCGMSPETVARVFDPFFTTKYTGRGLGLAAVLGIVRGHRGAIRIESEPGRGTTFSILLPASAAAAASAPGGGAAARRIAGGGRLVLLVDDDPSVRDAACRVLERVGFRVRQAGDGREALALLAGEARQAALVVADIAMPRMGGAALLAELRRDGSALPLLLVSGYSEVEAANAIEGDPHAGFVQKPFTIDQLLDAVGSLLAPR